MKSISSIHRISVLVPKNPFAPEGLKDKHHCLCALDVFKLMEWWPGTPHSPNRDATKVSAIQRSLDWKRVANIASYLLQKEISDAPNKINKYFKEIYQPKKHEPGREWPPKINNVISFQTSEFPTFSNVLIHLNGAEIKEKSNEPGVATLEIRQDDKNLNFSVIDGQHRINGAFLALCILREKNKNVKWEIPAEIFLDLDQIGMPPTKQAQIFIDVNFNQKKVDRSLVADLYPTTRAFRDSLDQTERAQDIGRKLMLETGPLVGMIQIPGIKYGVKDVIALATLNGAIENIIDIMEVNKIESLEMQTDFISQCLLSWFEASGRFESLSIKKKGELTPENVVYQGRILVSVIALIPAMIWKLKSENIQLVSESAIVVLTNWLKEVSKRANLLQNGVFINKEKFKQMGFLGSGGISRFRNSLWASVKGKSKIENLSPDEITELATKNRKVILSNISK